MTVSKKWCKIDIDSDNLDSYTNKHDDWKLVFAHHKEEEEICPLNLTEIADAQRKDQELKAYFKKKRNNSTKDLTICTPNEFVPIFIFGLRSFFLVLYLKTVFIL